MHILGDAAGRARSSPGYVADGAVAGLVYWRHTRRPIGRSAPMPALPSGTVTLLFTDVEGSTRLLQALGGERYAAVLAEHQRLLRAAFAKYGGREVDTQGDA